MAKQKKELTLTKTIVLIVLVGSAVYGAYHVGQPYFQKGFSGLAAKSSADALAKVRELYEQGQVDALREAIRPLIARPKDTPETLEALMLGGYAELQAGAAAEAVSLFERAHRECVSSPDHSKASLAYAHALEKAGDFPKAIALYEEIRSSTPPDIRAPALTGLGMNAEREGDLVGARDFYRQAVNDATWDSPEWNEAVTSLGRVNALLIFALQATPESQKYTVKKGDSITSIGNALNTTQGLLTRANGIEETSRLSLGQQLKYTPKDFRIIIERSKCRLFLVDKDGIFKVYKVGLGMPGHETTLGAYRIGNKEKNPVWHKPGEGPIPPLDPRNELGTRWMPLVPEQNGLPTDLGIHGTIAPDTIGQFSSHGCARLHKEDVEELYDLVVRATPADIVETVTADSLRGATQSPVDAAPPAATIPQS